MLNFILAFCLLIFSSVAGASNVIAGFQPSVRVGGVTLPLGRAIILSARTDSTTQFSTLLRNGSAYQVPTGKKLILLGAYGYHSSGTPTGISLGYGDASTTTTAPAGRVDFMGGASSFLFIFPANGTLSDGITFSWEIPAGKFPFIVSNSATTVNVILIGHLVDV